MPDGLNGKGTHVEHCGAAVPRFFYGTAWKEERTQALTETAIEAGFRAIDTANQRRHYFEAGVGEAVTRMIAAGRVRREELFLQTKFTYAAGQDHRLPYDPEAGFAEQVRQSFASSLEHLKTDYVDSYVLHGPLLRDGLTEADLETWRAMEALQGAGAARLIGVSNMDDDQLELLLEHAAVKPAFVQNRCFARTRWDARVREICRANDILYQGFSLLTANGRELNQPKIQEIARQSGCTIAQLVFSFSLRAGMIPLTGTTNPGHMREDLGAFDVKLSEADVEMIEKIAV